ncbi:MAG: InlB B-repeat-containing protein [Kiritimatiellaeota bacterium]|nr:InlB B-repeat-containing protein [Kiritimatiellota bacterium]
MTVTHGQPYGALPIPEKTGYGFERWTLDGVTVDAATTVTASTNHTLAAVWMPVAYAITYADTKGAVNANPATYTIEDAITFSPLPDVKGYTFAGWDAAGIAVGSIGDVTITAQWAEIPPYLSDPENAGGGSGSADGTGDAAPPLISTAYDGFLYDTNNTVRGTVTLKATMREKKVTDKATKAVSYTTNWTVSAKAVMQAASVSFSGKPAGALERFTAFTKNNAETLDVTLAGDRLYGTLSGVTAGGTLTVDGARAVFADKKDETAKDRLDKFRGVYNVALLETDNHPSLQMPSPVETDDYPSLPRGYLSLTVGNLGSVKYAGLLADGTKVSGSGKLLDFLNEDGWLAVALFRPLYSKKGFVGGLLWIDTDTQQVLVDTEYGWLVDWVCADPNKGGPFAYALDVLGGRFGDGKAAVAPPSGLAFSADCGWLAGTLALQWDGLTGGRWMEEAFPWELPVTPNGLKLSLDKGIAPKKPKGAAEYDYETVRGRNPSLATLSYTAKTGVFKGNFNLYYDGLNAKGALQHKTVSVPYSGLMVPHEGGLIGLGTGTATINKQKCGIPICLRQNEK